MIKILNIADVFFEIEIAIEIGIYYNADPDLLRLRTDQCSCHAPPGYNSVDFDPDFDFDFDCG